MVSSLTLRSLIHFEFIFVYGVRKSHSLIVIYILDGDRACVSPPLVSPGPGAGPVCHQGVCGLTDISPVGFS